METRLLWLNEARLRLLGRGLLILSLLVILAATFLGPWWVFDLTIIFFYGCTLAVLSLLLYQSLAPGFRRFAGMVAATLGVMAGLLDVLDTLWIWEVIDSPPHAASLDAYFWVSFAKRGLLAVAFLLLSGLFTIRSFWARTLALLCLVAGVAGATGLLLDSVLQVALMLAILTIGFAILLFTFQSDSLLHSL